MSEIIYSRNINVNSSNVLPIVQGEFRKDIFTIDNAHILQHAIEKETVRSLCNCLSKQCVHDNIMVNYEKERGNCRKHTKEKGEH